MEWSSTTSEWCDLDEAWYKYNALLGDAVKSKPPILIPENIIVFDIASKYRHLMVNNGEVNPSAIHFVMEYEDIPLRDRGLLVQKLQYYFMMAINKATLKRKQNGKKRR